MRTGCLAEGENRPRKEKGETKSPISALRVLCIGALASHVVYMCASGGDRYSPNRLHWDDFRLQVSDQFNQTYVFPTVKDSIIHILYF